MQRCELCGHGVVRAHRSLSEKLVYRAAYQCRSCGHRTGTMRALGFYFSAFSRCPRCGNPDPSKRSKRDKIDRMWNSPLSFFQHMIGGHLYHCTFCRIQFYDVRGSRDSSASTAKQAG